VALGEAGSPGLLDAFDGGDIAPTNVLIPLPGVNGVPFGLTQLAKLEPRLVDGSSSIPLRVVDTFDDLEGHATPFPSDGGGYGENLILLAPRWRLKPNTRYFFTVGTGSDATNYFGVSTGGGPDTTRPRWQRAPFLDPTPPKADQPLMPSYIITALDEPPELPLYVIVELQPLEPHAKPKRMIAALNLASNADTDSDCAFVKVWDHTYGVRTEDTDSDLGRRYLAKLTAMDAAGNQRRAPGSGVPIVWSGGVAICNRQAAVQSARATPPQPRWLGKPTHQASFDYDFNPSTRSRNTEYQHAFELPVETATSAFVELTIRRLKSPFTGYRRIALLWPTKPMSGGAGSPEPDGTNCEEPLITNTDRERAMPGDEPLAIRFAIIDSFGRRLAHDGPPLIVSHLHPHLSRVLVCATATSIAPTKTTN